MGKGGYIGTECGPWISHVSTTWELVEMQILRPHPRWTESGSLREGAAVHVLTGPAGGLDSVPVRGLLMLGSGSQLWLYFRIPGEASKLPVSWKLPKPITSECCYRRGAMRCEV